MLIEMVVKVFAVWLSILVLAIVNGALREVVFVPALGKPSALLLSGALLSGLILVVTYLALPWFGQVEVLNYIVIGLCWLCLTLVFEFSFGHFIQHKSWSQLLDAYTFKEGNIWLIVLLVTAVAPYVVARIKGWA